MNLIRGEHLISDYSRFAVGRARLPPSRAVGSISICSSRLRGSFALPFLRFDYRVAQNLVRVFLFFAFVFCTARGLSAESREVRFLHGLRQRQLFVLAETWTNERLQRTQLPPAERSELITELIRTYAEHAVNAPAAEQAKLWQLAQRTGEDYLRTQPSPPRQILIRVQQTLAKLAEGELARLHAETQGNEDSLEPAQQALRTARRQLEELQTEVQRLTAARGSKSNDLELSAEELAALGHHLAQQHCRVLRNIAQTYPPRDDNRLAALLEVIELAKKKLTQLPADDERAAEFQLEWLIAARLAGEGTAVETLLTQLQADSVPVAIRLPALAEGIRQALGTKNFAVANDYVQQGRKAGPTTHPEFDFAILELFLARWEAARLTKNTAAAQTEQQHSLEAAKFIEQTHGPFWGRRADQRLVSAIPASGATAEAELLKKSAENLYRKGDFTAAIAAYDKGAAQATEAKEWGTAFTLAYQAAAIQQQRKEHASARERLQTLALGQKDHRLAAEAHLLAAWNAAQLLAANEPGISSTASDDYVALLQEHLQHWPTGKTSDQARLWLGRISEQRRDWKMAAASYAAISPSAPEAEEVIHALGNCWRQQLLAAKGSAHSEIITAAEAYCRQSIMGESNRWPEEWSAAQRAAAQVWSELILDFRPANISDAEKVLTSARRGNPPPTPEWKQGADLLLVMIYASQADRIDQATELLTQLGNASTAELLILVDRLTQAATQAQPQVKKGLAGLQLATVQRLRQLGEKLSPAEKIALDRIEAQALSTQGDRPAAIAAFAKLAAAQPHDAAVQEAYAELLSAGNDPAAAELALKQWRIVAAKSKPRTPRWYRAKYALAKLQIRQKDPAGMQLVRYLLETPPGVSDEWRGKFEQLLKGK